MGCEAGSLLRLVSVTGEWRESRLLPTVELVFGATTVCGGSWRDQTFT